MTNIFPTTYTNLDDAQSIYFNRQLAHIKGMEFDVQYAAPKLFQLIPVDTTTPAGAEVAVYQVYDKNHRAKVINNEGNDIPYVNVSGKEVMYKLKNIASAYKINLQEIKAGAFSGKPLETRLINTVRDSIIRTMDYIGWYGDAVNGIPGWLNNAEVDKALVAGADVDSRRWFVDDNTRAAVKTPDQIIADMNSAIDFILKTSKGVEEPDTMVLPLSHFRYIQETARSAVSDTSILEFFKNANPTINVTWANEVAGSFAGNKNGFIVYKKAADKVYQEVPEMFEQLAPQAIDTHFKVICQGRYGGVIIPYPVSQAMRYGI